MNKLTFNILPFLLPAIAMKEGEETKPSRTDLFIQQLGLSDEIRSQLANEEVKMEDVVSKFKNDFGGLLKQSHHDAWDKEKEENIIKNTRIGTYNKIEKQTATAFGLNLADYKDIEKGRLEHMLKAAKKNFELNIEDWKTKASKAKDLPALEQYESQLKTANEELERLRKLEADVPNQIELARKGLLHDIYRKDHIRSVLGKLRKENQIIDHIDDDTILMHLNNTAILEVSEKDGDHSISIKEKKTGKPFMRSTTDNYKDVGALIVEKILSPKNWVKKSNGKPEGDSIVVSEGKQDKPKFKINQKAIDAANRR